MTINQGRHHPKNLMRCAARPPARYGDVELSVQASRCHASDPRNGCGHTPLNLYDRVEVALKRIDAKGRGHWVRRPSRELGIDGFDDLWLDPDEVPIAEYVPQERVQALREALIERARGQDGRTAERVLDAEPDRHKTFAELAADADERWRRSVSEYTPEMRAEDARLEAEALARGANPDCGEPRR